MHITLQTDRGPRDTLEDAAYAFTIQPCVPASAPVSVLMLLDGVGGDAGGEVASHLAAGEISAYLAAAIAGRGRPSGDGVCEPDSILEILRQALICANETVCARASETGELEGMATTVVCGVISGTQLYLGWAGDSRCYLYRRGSLAQLTRDHREVEQLIELGLLSRAQASKHALAHAITRYLGQVKDFCPSTASLDLQAGDVLMLCSDGLTDALTNEDITGVIDAFRLDHSSFASLADELVRRALSAGTQDNVTVLCCECPLADGPLQFSRRTLTDAYPMVLAQGFRHMFKESYHA